MSERTITTFNVGDAQTSPMRLDRGTQIRLFGASSGAQSIDMHINVLKVESGRGPYHYHANAENAYFVLEGVVEVIAEGVRYVLSKDDVAFVPPGVKHAAGNGGDIPARVLEIYSPVGEDFHIVGDADEMAVEEG
jgi:mannose-6-phosphate isomerase-like protein (cupin superfamily)